MEPTPLNNIAIQLGPFPIHWYGIILGTAVLIALLLAIREGKKKNIHPDFWLDLMLFAVPVAIIFARLYYVVFEWNSYKNNPIDAFKIWEGGLAIHGALIGSVLVGIFYTRYKKVSFWSIADIAAPSIIMGQAIGRWGNFMNQEAHGGPISAQGLESFWWNILPEWIRNQMFIKGAYIDGQYIEQGQYYHPTFLYESLWNVVGFVLLLIARRFNPRRGELFLFYVTWYSIGRFFIEGLRTDSLWLIPGVIRMAQLIGVILIILMVVIYIYRRKTGLADARYNDPVNLTTVDNKGE